MNKKRNMFLGVSIALFSLALTGCPERIRIGDIERDPGRYYNREVTVAGRVVRSYGAAGAGVYEVDDGTVRHGGSNRDPVELAFELGQHESDRPRGSGRRRDEVDAGGASPAQILVREVEHVLVIGVRVHSRHEALLDRERVV